VREWISMGAILAAFATHASTRTAVVAAGRCDDPDLLRQSRELTQALRARIGAELLDGNELLKRFPPSASRLPAELQRQIDGAELQYFAADYGKAQARVLEALAEIERLPPGEARWQLHVRGVLLRALTLRATGRAEEADEQLRRILRLDPDYRMDADYFSPSTRARFDRLRRQLVSQPKATLVVTSNPTGAEIFVDGLAMKRTTPASLELPAGRYAFSLAKDSGFSFSRDVEVGSSSSLHVDLEFESSFQPTLPPCFAEAGNEQFRLSNAVKLGSWLSVDQVVIARVEQQPATHAWTSAALVQVSTGQKMREGAVAMDGSDDSSNGLGELAEFICTGNASQNIVSPDVFKNPSERVPASAEPRRHLNEGIPLREELAPMPPRPVDSSKGWSRFVGGGLLGLGTLAIGAGLIFQLRSDRSRAELERYYADGRPPAVAQMSAVHSLTSRMDSQRTAAIVSYVVGAAVASAGAFFILNRSANPDPHPAVSVHVMPEALSISTSWR
jgi:hypothetical protein